MDLFEPSDPRPVHFIGIGGAGMSALALIAHRRGVHVTGCDADPAGAADVVALGVSVTRGHDPAHVAGARAVVATAAVPADHPELAAARAAGVPVVPRKEALAQLVARGRTVAIAGTHGKTTTTVMATEAFRAAGLAPTGIAGGRVEQWGGNALLEGDALFVVEADEFDRAFLALRPTVAVVNNVEADHLECYGSLAAIEDAFVEFAGHAETVVAGADDPGAERVARRLGRPVVRFGLAADADLRISEVRASHEGTAARLRFPGGEELSLVLAVPGMHNVRNATAALGALHAAGGSPAAALPALAAFRGVGRRFERLGERRGIAVVDDYAHHASEVAATLGAARQAFPGRRLVAVFQPHLYSRTAAQHEALGAALAEADLVVVTEIYAAREQPIAGVSGRQVAEAARRAGREVIFEPLLADLGPRLQSVVRSGDVVLTLGAGDITRIGRELVRWLDAA